MKPEPGAGSGKRGITTESVNRFIWVWGTVFELHLSAKRRTGSVHSKTPLFQEAALKISKVIFI